jgi:hypothetical protein
MNTGRLERGANLALIESIRRQKIAEILARMKLDSKLRGMAEQQMEEAETGEDPFELVNLEDTMVTFLRMMTCDLKEALDKEKMEMEVRDLLQLKEAAMELFGRQKSTVEEMKDWDDYMLGLFHESRLVVYKGDIGVKAIEKIAIESVEGMFSVAESTAQIKRFRDETRKKLKKATQVPEEMKELIGDRLSFMCGEAFENMRESFANPENFLIFAMEQINRFALENYEGITEKLVHLDEMKKEIIEQLDQRYGRMLFDHRGWINLFFQQTTSQQPQQTRKGLWEALFDLWASELLDNVQKKKGTGGKN